MLNLCSIYHKNRKKDLVLLQALGPYTLQQLSLLLRVLTKTLSTSRDKAESAKQHVQKIEKYSLPPQFRDASNGVSPRTVFLERLEIELRERALRYSRVSTSAKVREVAAAMSDGRLSGLTIGHVRDWTSHVGENNTERTSRSSAQVIFSSIFLSMRREQACQSRSSTKWRTMGESVRLGSVRWTRISSHEAKYLCSFFRSRCPSSLFMNCLCLILCQFASSYTCSRTKWLEPPKFWFHSASTCQKTKINRTLSAGE